VRNLLIALVLVTIAQIAAYFQLQSQFIWTWAKNNTIIMAFAGVPISVLLIWFSHYCSIYFEGQVWPGRLIGFSVGAIVFAFLSHYVMHEPFSTKTLICLGLAFCILMVQIFWK
jgi:peptidoglycan/LPS O-acetylase OafA/YrhL